MSKRSTYFRFANAALFGSIALAMTISLFARGSAHGAPAAKGELVDPVLITAGMAEYPAGLAEPEEIPADAGCFIRVGQGWSWKRSPQYHRAPLPSDWLHRRMAMSVSDQVARRVEARHRPRGAVNPWTKAKNERQEQARSLARMAWDRESYEDVIAELREEETQLRALIARLRVRAEDEAEGQPQASICASATA